MGGGGENFWFFCLFPMCSRQVLMFPEMFLIAPQIYPILFGQSSTFTNISCKRGSGAWGRFYYVPKKMMMSQLM